MPIPPEIDKDIEQVQPNSAGTKILIRCLIGAIIAMSGVIVWYGRGSNQNAAMALTECHMLNNKKDTEIARLNNYIINEAQDDVKRERANEDKLNEIIDKYKTVLK